MKSMFDYKSKDILQSNIRPSSISEDRKLNQKSRLARKGTNIYQAKRRKMYESEDDNREIVIPHKRDHRVGLKELSWDEISSSNIRRNAALVSEIQNSLPDSKFSSNPAIWDSMSWKFIKNWSHKWDVKEEKPADSNIDASNFILPDKKLFFAIKEHNEQLQDHPNEVGHDNSYSNLKSKNNVCIQELSRQKVTTDTSNQVDSERKDYSNKLEQMRSSIFSSNTPSSNRQFTVKTGIPYGKGSKSNEEVKNSIFEKPKVSTKTEHTNTEDWKSDMKLSEDELFRHYTSREVKPANRPKTVPRKNSKIKKKPIVRIATKIGTFRPKIEVFGKKKWDFRISTYDIVELQEEGANELMKQKYKCMDTSKNYDYIHKEELLIYEENEYLPFREYTKGDVLYTPKENSFDNEVKNDVDKQHALSSLENYLPIKELISFKSLTEEQKHFLKNIKYHYMLGSTRLKELQDWFSGYYLSIEPISCLLWFFGAHKFFNPRAGTDALTESFKITNKPYRFNLNVNSKVFGVYVEFHGIVNTTEGPRFKVDFVYIKDRRKNWTKDDKNQVKHIDDYLAKVKGEELCKYLKIDFEFD